MSDNLEDVLNDMNRQYDHQQQMNDRDTEMEFKNQMGGDDDEDVVDMNYLLSAGANDDFENDNISPQMK